jgi:hypothetical protein
VQRVRASEGGSARRLKDLQQENSKLKRLVSELSLKDRLLRSIDNPFKIVHHVGLFEIDDYFLRSAANEDTVEFFRG